MKRENEGQSRRSEKGKRGQAKTVVKSETRTSKDTAVESENEDKDTAVKSETRTSKDTAVKSENEDKDTAAKS